MRVPGFLTPTPGKGLLYAGFAIANAFVIRRTVIFDGQLLAGFPLGFFPVGSSWSWGAAREPLAFSYPALALDAALWWLGACLLAEGGRALARRRRKAPTTLT